MKKTLLLIFTLILSVSVNAQHTLSSDGNAVIERQINSDKSIEIITQDLIEVISPNYIYGGKIISTSNEKIIASYVLKNVKKAFPISIDANIMIEICKKNDAILASITLMDYQKHTGLVNNHSTIPIKDTKPLNPKGSNFGFSASQIKDSFSNVVLKANDILNKIEIKISSN